MVSPTSPVAPTTATRKPLLIVGLTLRSGSGLCASRVISGVADSHVGVLRAVAQVMIHQHDRQHRLGDRRGAQADAGIVAAGGHHFDRIAVQVDGAPRHLDARGRLQAQVHHDRLAGGYATEHAAGVIGRKSRGRELIAMLAAALAATATPSPISTALTALMPIIACGDVGIELVEHRLAQPGRHAFGASP